MEIAPAVPEWLLLASAMAVGGLVAVAMLARLLDAVLELG